MNAFGLSLLIKMGCICGKETLMINNRRFYVRSRLGEGGFSYVDLIEDARNHKLFALKRIMCHSKEDERVAIQEVEVLQSFKHPNLVPLEDSTMVPIDHHSKTLDLTSEVLIVMPFYSRGSLQDRIELFAKRSERFREEKIWEVFQGICRGVKAMHHFNPPYAHRDLKPANVMMADDETPVIMDMGSAAKARVEIKTMLERRALQDTAAERCSMQYRAPELFNVETNSSIDERTDIWSLGCLLYAVAFLESPFEKTYQRGDSIALAVMGGNVRFPENSEYSKFLEELISLLMIVNPMERPFIDQVIEKVNEARNTCENRV